MPGGVGRLGVIAALLTLAGLVLCVRGSLRLLRAVRDRFTYGAPYRSGTLQDRFTGLLLEIPVLLVGLALGFLALGQAHFQPSETTVRVGQIEARRTEWGKVTVRFVPDPRYPGDRVLEGEISGARWAVAGDFITWDRGVKWLGFRDGHRLRYLLGTRDTTGLTPGARTETTVLEPLPGAAFRMLAMASYIPFLKVTTQASQWFVPAERQALVLYAIGPGYLGEVASRAGAGSGRSPRSGRDPIGSRLTAICGRASLSPLPDGI
jgi:hypothetical protein